MIAVPQLHLHGFLEIYFSAVVTGVAKDLDFLNVERQSLVLVSRGEEV